MVLRYLTAGESHGAALVGILEGLPAGIPVASEDFSDLMARRLMGYGRGSRSKAHTDHVEVLSGVVAGKTIGSPVALLIRNGKFSQANSLLQPFSAARNYENCLVPLPGHADLPGAIKYRLDDCRLIRERASARETAMRVALSVIPRNFLTELGIYSTCFVDSIAGINADVDLSRPPEEIARSVSENGSEFLSPDEKVQAAWKTVIDEADAKNSSLGGTGTVIFWNLPVGLGSHVHADRRLDAIFASMVLSIPSVKSVEINGGIGTVEKGNADTPYFTDEQKILYSGNNCGGIEGGISNGQPVVVRFKVKPLPGNSASTSLNIRTQKEEKPAFYRSDTCVLPAVAIVAESVLAISLVSEILQMTGGFNFSQIRQRFEKIRENELKF